MTVKYTDPELVKAIKVTETPRNPYPSGYGAKIPLRYMVKYGTHWRRVYVMCYSNVGSTYVNVKGEDLFLDTLTEYALEDAGRKHECKHEVTHKTSDGGVACENCNSPL